MVGLTLGTGVGGVVAVNGRVHLGHDGTAGEVGHQTIDPDGPSCNCGNNGCLEAFARADRMAEACGTDTVEAAVKAAAGGDTRALEGLARVGRYIGIGIANMITIISPDRVVIGGGIAAAGDLLMRPIRDEVRRRVLTTSLTEVEIVTAELGTWAGAIGAAVHGAEAEAEVGAEPGHGMAATG
jgi:glucokinase